MEIRNGDRVEFKYNGVRSEGVVRITDGWIYLDTESSADTPAAIFSKGLLYQKLNQLLGSYTINAPKDIDFIERAGLSWKEGDILIKEGKKYNVLATVGKMVFVSYGEETVYHGKSNTVEALMAEGYRLEKDLIYVDIKEIARWKDTEVFNIVITEEDTD